MTNDTLRISLSIGAALYANAMDCENEDRMRKAIDHLYAIVDQEKAKAVQGVLRSLPRHKHLPCEWNDGIDGLLKMQQEEHELQKSG